MTYRERREARAERLRGWAETREAKSASAFAGVNRITEGIPFGQPILVGHHSERHARRDQDRIWNGMEKGIEHADKAASMNSRADEIERQADQAIYSDDPDAIERLTEKLAGMEAKRELMKARNVEFRKSHKAELKAEPSAYQRSLMMPHQSYELQNLGGNISRARERLASLRRPETWRQIYARFDSRGDCGHALVKGTVILYHKTDGTRCTACGVPKAEEAEPEATA